MKNTILLFCMLLFSTILCAATPPDAVRKAFNQKFPKAIHVKWDKENDHEYEASFKWKGAKYSANFSDQGEWLETESTTAFHQLPEKVQSTFNASHQGASVKAAAKIETSKGTIKYEVEFKQGAKTAEIIYSAEGAEIK